MWGFVDFVIAGLSFLLPRPRKSVPDIRTTGQKACSRSGLPVYFVKTPEEGKERIISKNSIILFPMI